MTTDHVSVTAQLRQLFCDYYSLARLPAAERDAFVAHIRGLIGSIDAAGEGYLDASKQRDLAVKFHWGHDHDFGDGIVIPGRMANRHLDILGRFVADFGLPLDLRGKKVLDIGVWTGGTSLLLAAMGADVLALEEVVKYADTVNYLARAFGVAGQLKCIPKTLYDALPLFADHFDYVIYSGVIYHVTDPLLSLRMVYSALKDGGNVFLETYGFDSPQSVCRYEGPSIIHSGNVEDMNRGGWNYFIPSSSCLEAWSRDAGFHAVRVATVHDRLLGVAERRSFEDFCRAGLSRSNVR